MIDSRRRSTTPTARLAILGALALGAVSGQSEPDRTAPLESIVVARVIVPDASTPARPRPDQPLPYLLIGGAVRHIGGPTAGVDLPDRPTIEAELTTVLEQEGFRRVGRIGDPLPVLLLSYAYGEAIAEFETTETVDPESGTSTSETTDFNTHQIAALIGANEARAHAGEMSEGDYQRLGDALRYDRLYLIVYAWDADAARRREKVLRWETRISIDARRQSLSAALPRMLRDAASLFGSDRRLPTITLPRDRKSRVEIGDSVVVPNDAANPPDDD